MLFIVAVLFLGYGLWLPRAPVNSAIGIRTPWTLESEPVWRATHKLAGRTFIVGAIITAAAAFSPAEIQPLVAVGALLVAGFVPVAYSYIVRQREH